MDLAFAWSPIDRALSLVYGRWSRDRLALAIVPRIRARNQELARAFGHRLRTIREAKGLTQEALAHAAGLHPTYISNVERGYSAPTLTTLIRLAASLDVRPGEMVDGLSA